MLAPVRSRFLVVLGIVVAVAFGVRVVYVLSVARYDKKFYDAAYYELQARTIADGHGYTDPFEYLPYRPHRAVPAADHPPLTVLALVPVAAAGSALHLGATGTRLAMRFEVMLVGVAAVGLIGLLGREVAGERAGLVAAAIAAVYPYLWVNDGLLMAEAFAATAVTGALLLALRLARSPSLGSGIALGAVCGVAALARAELVLLAPLLGLALLFAFRSRPLRERLVLVGGLAALVIVVGPWVAFNLSRFDEPVLISTNDGIAMLGSNCDAVYRGGGIGLTNLGVCLPKTVPRGDASVISRIYRDRAMNYMREHKRRVPLVVAARVGRDWGAFRPMDMLRLNEGEGRPRWITGAGMFFYYPLVLLALGGVVVLRRHRLRQWPLFVPPAIVSVGALLSYGQTRFRVPAEPSLVVLAAVALTALSTRWWPEAEAQRQTMPAEAQAPSSTIAASPSS